MQKIKIEIDWEKAKTPTPFHPIPLDTQLYIKELESRFERIVEQLEEHKLVVEIDDDHIVPESDVDEFFELEVVALSDAIEIVKGGVDNAE